MNLLGSKAVGEPPFVLGLSVWAAVKDALRTSPGEAAALSYRPPVKKSSVLYSPVR